jgi:hypothetical protein
MIKETRLMTETAVENEQAEQVAQAPSSAVSDEQLVAMLVDRARSEGLQLTGEGGLLQQLTKRVPQAIGALDPHRAIHTQRFVLDQLTALNAGHNTDAGRQPLPPTVRPGQLGGRRRPLRRGHRSLTRSTARSQRAGKP